MADKIAELYQVAQKKGVLKQGMTEDMFRQQTQTDDGLKSFYDYATTHGLRLQPYDTFKTGIRSIKQIESEQHATQTTNPTVENNPAPTTNQEEVQSIRMQEQADRDAAGVQTTMADIQQRMAKDNPYYATAMSTMQSEKEYNEEKPAMEKKWNESGDEQLLNDIYQEAQARAEQAAKKQDEANRNAGIVFDPRGNASLAGMVLTEQKRNAERNPAKIADEFNKLLDEKYMANDTLDVKSDEELRNAAGMTVKEYQQYKRYVQDKIQAYLINANLPQSDIEYFARKFMQGNMIGQMYNLATQPVEQRRIEQQSQAEYAQDNNISKVADFATDVTAMLTDPIIMVGGATGSLARKGVESVGKRILEKAGVKEAEVAAKRAMAQRGIMQTAQNLIGSAATMATISGASTAMQQAYIGEYNPMQVLEETAKGAAVGTVLGLGHVAGAAMQRAIGDSFGRNLGLAAGRGTSYLIGSATLAGSSILNQLQNGVKAKNIDYAGELLHGAAMQLVFDMQGAAKSIYQNGLKNTIISAKNAGANDLTKEEVTVLNNKGYNGNDMFSIIRNMGGSSEREFNARWEEFVRDSDIDTKTKYKVLDTLVENAAHNAQPIYVTDIEHDGNKYIVRTIDNAGQNYETKTFATEKEAQDYYNKANMATKHNARIWAEHVLDMSMFAQEAEKTMSAVINVTKSKYTNYSEQKLIDILNKKREVLSPEEIGVRDFMENEFIKSANANISQRASSNIRKITAEEIGISTNELIQVLGKRYEDMTNNERIVFDIYLNNLKKYAPRREQYAQPVISETGNKAIERGIEIDKQTNETDGQLHPIFLYGDANKQGYILKGLIEDDGAYLVVMDENGVIKQVPKRVVSVAGDPMDAELAKSQMTAHATAIDEINKALKVGDKLKLNSPEYEGMETEVTAIDQDGNVTIMTDEGEKILSPEMVLTLMRPSEDDVLTITDGEKEVVGRPDTTEYEDGERRYIFEVDGESITLTKNEVNNFDGWSIVEKEPVAGQEEPMQEQTTETSSEPIAMQPSYPTTQDGKPYFAQMDAAQAAQVAIDFLGDKQTAKEWIANRVAQAKKEVERLNKKKVADSDDIQSYRAAMEQSRMEKEQAQQMLDKWQRALEEISKEPVEEKQKQAQEQVQEPATQTITQEQPKDMAQGEAQPTDGKEQGEVGSAEPVAKTRNTDITEMQIEGEWVSNLEKAVVGEKLSLKDAVLKSAMDGAKAADTNAAKLSDAVKMLDGRLSELRKAARFQKEGDKETLKTATTMAKIFIRSGWLGAADKKELLQVISSVGNVLDKADMKDATQQILLAVTEANLVHIEYVFDKMRRIKATKSNLSNVTEAEKLDVATQYRMETFNECLDAKLSADQINERIDNLYDELDNPESDKMEIRNRLQGLYDALEYLDGIGELKAEEYQLKAELATAKNQSYAGLPHPIISKRETLQGLRDAIIANRLDQAEAYRKIIADTSTAIEIGMEGARAFRTAQDQHVNDIRHMANSDMQGIDDSVHDEKQRSKIKESLAKGLDIVMLPFDSLNSILKQFGGLTPNGEGKLYDHFIRKYVDSSDSEYKELTKEIEVLDNKASELLGRKATWADLADMMDKDSNLVVSVIDTKGTKDIKLSQGQLAYIYALYKMADGRMKLNNMGITDETMADIENALNPIAKEAIDWLQNDFLPRTRVKYNKVHERMFGAPMAKIDNYFPIVINKQSINSTTDIANDTEGIGNVTGTTTGAIKRRTRNSRPIDLETNAFNVAVSHLIEMEHWAAFSEFTRDANILINYQRFKRQLNHMTTVYGSGDRLYTNLKNALKLAAGTYIPQKDKASALALNVAKGVSASKVTFRLYTALKQILSHPAFWTESHSGIFLKEYLKNISTPKGCYDCYKWAMDNLPLFSKRVNSRKAGDTILMDNESDWAIWHTKVVEWASRVGMSPNAFVDALTCAQGAKAIYEYKRKDYIIRGYSAEEAEKRALQDASIAFNETQQSSEGAFMAPIQRDESVMARFISLFNNANMAYNRRAYESINQLILNYTQKDEQIARQEKRYRDEGFSDEQAKKNAEKDWRQARTRNLIGVVIYMYLIQAAWRLGAKVPYLLFGDDDKEKERMAKESFGKGAFATPVRGTLIGKGLETALDGYGWKSVLSVDAPIMTDIDKIMNMAKSGKKVELITSMTNMLAAILTGADPASLTNAAVAISDTFDGNLDYSNDFTTLLFTIMCVPESQTRAMYVDELGHNAAEIQDMLTYDPNAITELA